jgi:RND superfamily putative drug exporter
MRILGQWNWYLPKWLEWLPDLRIEGTAPPVMERNTQQAAGGTQIGVGEVQTAGD